MDGLAVGVRLLVASVFIIAGVFKLADLTETREMLINSGFKPAWSRSLAIGLPVVELLIAAALVAPFSAWLASVAAIAVLAAFSIVIAVNLKSGRRVVCRCFGQLGSAPIGRPTLVRNAVLIAAAGAIALRGPGASADSAFAWLGDLPPSAIVAGIAVLVLFGLMVWILLAILRQNGRLLVRVEKLEESLWRGSVLAGPAIGLPVGALAPSFELPLASGGVTSLEALRVAGKPILLIFGEPQCGPCNDLLLDIGRWQREYGDKVTIAMLTNAISRKRPAAEHALDNVLLQGKLEVQQAYNATLASAVAIGTDGRIASPLCVGRDRVECLLGRILDGSLLALRLDGHTHGPGLHLPDPIQPGAVAPALRLRDVEGTFVDPVDHCEKNTLLLFWNPSCPLCRNLLADLRAWESRRATDTARLVVIATGAGVRPEQLDVSSVVLYDGQSLAAQSFGVYGTPTAMILDKSGRVTSETAVGTAAVRAMLRTF